MHFRMQTALLHNEMLFQISHTHPSVTQVKYDVLNCYYKWPAIEQLYTITN